MDRLAGLQVYLVGGAVRDRLLGIANSDRDWVVVGTSPEEMQARGFRPVGQDFPVFLHPETHEEYALARTERKTAAGYHGFIFHTSPAVTLEQDLQRRDLTINAMAIDGNGQLIDPCHGQPDLTAGLLRHVSPAFAEDPVRVLRVARFAARFGFQVASETMQLMHSMVVQGEVDALVAERVWQETARALMERRPSAFFRCLRQAGALARILPEIDALFGLPLPGHQLQPVDTGQALMQTLDLAASQPTPLAGRFAVLVHNLDKALTSGNNSPAEHAPAEPGLAALKALCDRLRVPAACKELARLVLSWQQQIDQAEKLDATECLQLFKQSDALRRPDRFTLLLDTVAIIAQKGSAPYPPAVWLKQRLDAARRLDAGELAAQTTDRRRLPEMIDRARIQLINDTLSG